MNISSDRTIVFALRSLGSYYMTTILKQCSEQNNVVLQQSTYARHPYLHHAIA